MADQDLPRLQRDIPKPMAWLATLMMYGVLKPLNACMTRGGGKPMVLRRSKRYRKML